MCRCLRVCSCVCRVAIVCVCLVVCLLPDSNVWHARGCGSGRRAQRDGKTRQLQPSKQTHEQHAAQHTTPSHTTRAATAQPAGSRRAHHWACFRSRARCAAGSLPRRGWPPRRGQRTSALPAGKPGEHTQRKADAHAKGTTALAHRDDSTRPHNTEADDTEQRWPRCSRARRAQHEGGHSRRAARDRREDSDPPRLLLVRRASTAQRLTRLSLSLCADHLRRTL